MEIDQDLTEFESLASNKVTKSNKNAHPTLKNSVFQGFSSISIDKLVLLPDLPLLIKTLPVLDLISAVKEKGLADSLEVIEWVRGTQLQAVLDFEWWNDRSSQLGLGPTLNTRKIWEWIEAWNEIGDDFAAKRLMELEEETLVLSFKSFVEVVPVNSFKEETDIPEDYLRTGDNLFLFKVVNENERQNSFLIKDLIDSIYKIDSLFAQSLMSHCALLSYDEYQHLAERWRSNRISDLGFSGRESGIQLLKPMNKKELISEVSRCLNSECSSESMFFFDQESTLDQVFQALKNLDGNELSSFLIRTFGESKLRERLGLMPQSSIQWAQIEDDELLEEAAQMVCESAKQVFVTNFSRTPVGLISAPEVLKHDFFLRFLSQIDEISFDKSLAYKGKILALVNTLSCAFGGSGGDHETMRRSGAIVAGALNIALSVEPDFLGSLREEIFKIPPVYLFKAGWNKVVELASYTLECFLKLKGDYEVLRSIEDEVKVRFSDDQFAKWHVRDLFRVQRFAEVKQWLNSHGHLIEPRLMFFLNAVLGRIPEFPLFLEDSKQSSIMVTGTRPFVTFDDLEKVRSFSDKLVFLNKEDVVIF